MAITSLPVSTPIPRIYIARIVLSILSPELLNLASTLPLAEAMKLETSVTTQGMLDPEAAARARAALAGEK